MGGEVWRRAEWALDSSIIDVLEVAKTCSYKKDDEPLLNLTGAMSRCSREKVLVCTQKRELESPL